jgi:mercuric ion binding protein
MRTGWPERLALAAALIVSLGALAGEPERAVLDVPSMYCSLCPITVRKALERVPGVIEAKADFAGKRAEVKYDPDKITPQQLAGAVTDAGYPATVKPQ